LRVAICFSGQPRFVNECYAGIKNNLLDQNPGDDFDVFVHTWYSEDSAEKVLYSNELSSFSGDAKIKSGVIEDIKKLYSPKKIITDEPKKIISDICFDNVSEKYFAGYSSSGLTRKEFGDIKVNNLYSMWYSILQSNLLKREYELSSGKIYDIVIRFRFDNICRRPIVLNDINPDFLYYQEMGQPDGMISDWINISSSKNMDTYSSIFNNIKNLKESLERSEGVYCNELFIREICQKFNIPTMSRDFGLELPRWGKL
jgi:hypothetical protein